MAHHHKMDCLVKRLNFSVVVKVKVKIPVNVHLDDISSTAEPSITKFGTVVHHHGPECRARRLVCCLQIQSHWGHTQSNMTVSTISTELLIFLQPNLIRWYTIISCKKLQVHNLCDPRVKNNLQVMLEERLHCVTHDINFNTTQLGSLVKQFPCNGLTSTLHKLLSFQPRYIESLEFHVLSTAQGYLRTAWKKVKKAVLACNYFANRLDT